MLKASLASSETLASDPPDGPLSAEGGDGEPQEESVAHTKPSAKALGKRKVIDEAGSGSESFSCMTDSLNLLSEQSVSTRPPNLCVIPPMQMLGATRERQAHRCGNILSIMFMMRRQNVPINVSKRGVRPQLSAMLASQIIFICRSTYHALAITVAPGHRRHPQVARKRGIEPRGNRLVPLFFDLRCCEVSQVAACPPPS
jgi:hypothetical protein